MTTPASTRISRTVLDIIAAGSAVARGRLTVAEADERIRALIARDYTARKPRKRAAACRTAPKPPAS
jgi:hypothetical protein